jgi:dipeptidyl aminopeptidase/acylaminoacyl peptidase
MNDALLSQIDMQPLEAFTFKGSNNEDIQGFLVKPPGFDPNKKYPLKFLIHGGPQGAWGNEWTYRWNAELLAASGNYVVVMINFHGSTGYGQKFTDGEDLSVYRQKPRSSAGRELRRLYGELVVRPYQSLQMHCVARRHV